MNNQWYIGQKVVALRSTSCRTIIKGNTYTVSDVSECQCGTCLHILGVGQYMSNCCSWCEDLLPFGWQQGPSKHFRPIDALTETMERIEREGAPVEHPELLPA